MAPFESDTGEREIFHRTYKYTVEFENLISAAKNVHTSAEELHTVALRSPEAVRELVAKNPNTNAETLRLVFNKRNEPILFNLAENPNTPVDILEAIATKNVTHPENKKLYLVALKNPSIKIEFLKEIVEQGSNLGQTWLAVIFNPNCTPDLLNTIFVNVMKNFDKSFTLYHRGQLMSEILRHKLVTVEQMKQFMEKAKDPAFSDNIRPTITYVAQKLIVEDIFFENWPVEWVEAHYGISKP